MGGLKRACGPWFVMKGSTVSRLVVLLFLVLAAPAAAGTGLWKAAGAARNAAPPFSVRTLDGKVVRHGDLRGRPVLIDFWATWCVPCRATLPQLDTLQSRYRAQGLFVLGLSVDDDEPRQVRRFAGRLGLWFQIAMADEMMLELYGPIRVIPTTFFIDRRGDIVRRVTGPVDGETLDDYARELLGP